MKITVDNREYEVPPQDEGKDLLAVLLHLGFDVPYFCWHPALGSVGACRQCAVRLYRNADDTHGKIEMACMVPVKDGLRLSVEDPEAVVFRRRVIEWLMVNHPHDCPVCDEGGECHLQDMTVLTGHVYRRYQGHKRTYRNQHLGPFVAHEMNRCIQCYRCVRFYREYAGGRDFDVFASKNHVYFGRFEDGPLESEFSGNLVELCPTGVFTDRTLARHYTRKWDLETAPSVCPHCGLGCNTIPGARYGELRRVHARFNKAVNGYFLCDRGRYGYEFVNDPARLRRPRTGRGRHEEVDWTRAMVEAHEGLVACGRVIGIGSPRAGLEANFALRALVGEDSFFSGLSAREQAGIEEALAILRDTPARSAPLREVEWADAALVLGADPTNEAPMLDLALRRGSFHAVLPLSRARDILDWNDYPVRDVIAEARGPLYLIASARPKLAEIATETHFAPPPEVTALAWEIARALDDQRFDEDRPASRIAAAMTKAARPLVVASTTWGKDLLHAAVEIARLLSQGREQPCLISLLAPECNSYGVGLLGGPSTEAAFEALASGQADGAVVLENDLYRRASARRVTEALGRLRFLVALDHLLTQTAAAADVVLPVSAFAELTGTYVNTEGRAQRFFQVFVPEGEPRPAWQVLRGLAEMRHPGRALWSNVEDVLLALAESDPGLAGAQTAAPSINWRGVAGERIARAPHREAGRTAKDADRTVFEPPPPEDENSPFAFTMEGVQTEPPPALLPRYWLPGWNSVQARDRYQIEAAEPKFQAPGVRLLEPGGGRAYTPAPPEPPLAEGEIWVVPRAAIFGSEELSRLAPGIAELTPSPAVVLHPEEAHARGLAEGDVTIVILDGDRYLLEAHLDDGVARGSAIVPAGYPETAGLDGPARGRIEKLL